MSVGVRLEEGCVSDFTPLEFVEGVGSVALLLQMRNFLLGAVDFRCKLKVLRLVS